MSEENRKICSSLQRLGLKSGKCAAIG